MRERLLYIYNVHAGKGIPPVRILENIEAMTRAGYLVTAYPTEKDMDYRALLKEFGEGQLVCSGGDGMLNAIINALFPDENLRGFGYIPAGTTNDFARSIGISRDNAEALETALTGTCRHIDAGRLNDRHFIYVAAFGTLTNISYITSQNIKNMIGYFAYVLQGIRELSELKSTHVRIRLEENGTWREIEDDFIVGMITNSASVAGFKSIGNGDYSYDDGLFELALLRMPERLSDIRCLLSGLRESARVPECDCLIYAQSAHIIIESEEEIAYTLDGEYGGSFLQADVVNLHRQLAIRC